jgi:hypothetical protein
VLRATHTRQTHLCRSLSLLLLLLLLLLWLLSLLDRCRWRSLPSLCPGRRALLLSCLWLLRSRLWPCEHRQAGGRKQQQPGGL